MVQPEPVQEKTLRFRGPEFKPSNKKGGGGGGRYKFENCIAVVWHSA